MEEYCISNASCKGWNDVASSQCACYVPLVVFSTFPVCAGGDIGTRSEVLINQDYTFELFLCLAILQRYRKSIMACSGTCQLYEVCNGCVFPPLLPSSSFPPPPHPPTHLLPVICQCSLNSLPCCPRTPGKAYVLLNLCLSWLMSAVSCL